MKDPRCTICHEKPLFPVRFTCFPCSFLNTSHEKRNCSTLTVVCMECADRYLELNKKPEERSLSKRCLFCDKTVDPLCLTKEIAYELLHPIMDLDDDLYRCPHLGCFFQGCHLDLLDHTKNQCEYRTVRCRECFTTYQAVFEEMHKMNHPCHTECTVCNEFVTTRRFTQHMEEEHAHYVQCTACDAYIPEYTLGFHMRDKHQGQECRYCGNWVWYRNGDESTQEKFLRHINNDECQGTLECPLCVEGTPSLKPKDILGHLRCHETSVQLFLRNYEDLLGLYTESLIRDRDHLLHTEWVRKIITEKNKEAQTVQKFIRKHERFWV